MLSGPEKDDLSEVRLVASDMDRTLLADDGSMPEGMGGRIAALEAAGVTFAAASGRELFTLRELFGEAGARMAFVSDNGATVTLGSETVFASLLEPSDVAGLLAATDGCGPDRVPVVCGLDEVFVPAWGRRHDRGLRAFFHELTYVDDLRDVRAPSNKFSLFCPLGDAGAAREELLAPAFGERLAVVCGGPDWVDVTRRETNKGTGLARLCARLGVDRRDVVALGDTDNDVEMLERVGHGYLVANAPERMEVHARFRAPSNNDRGVAQVIDRLLAVRAASREEAS